MFLKSLSGAALASVLLPAGARHALAKDGGHDGGHDGHEGGHDDHGGRRNGGDDDGNDDGGGMHQDDVLRARRNGRIISLKTALGIIDANIKGKVIDVRLSGGQSSVYRIKVRRESGEITTIRLDARTGTFVGRPGF